MNRLAAALQGIDTALRARGRKYALVGGLAVGARATERFTRDIDLAVATDETPTSSS